MRCGGGNVQRARRRIEAVHMRTCRPRRSVRSADAITGIISRDRHITAISGEGHFLLILCIKRYAFPIRHAIARAPVFDFPGALWPIRDAAVRKGRRIRFDARSQCRPGKARGCSSATAPVGPRVLPAARILAGSGPARIACRRRARWNKMVDTAFAFLRATALPRG